MPDTHQTLVMKFGGTSVGSAEALNQATHIIKEAREKYPRVIVITSAMSGVTDLLLKSATLAAQGNTTSLVETAAMLQERHFSAADALIHDEALREETKHQINGLVGSLVDLCRAIAVLGEASPRALDAVASLGERMSVRLLGAVVQSAGVQASVIESSEFIITNSHFQSANPDFDATKEQTRRCLGPLLERGSVVITTGFIGATPAGVITTLGRGGSDYSAGIIGSVLPADDVWIWTDVDGVMTADPRLVSGARTLPEINYSEIVELAYYGAKVVHPKTIRPLVEAGIGLRICNTFNPSHPGTRLIPNGHANRKTHRSETVIKAVTAIRRQKLVTIEGRGMLGVPGVAARAFGAVASTGTSVPLITQASSEQSICFAIPTDSAEEVLHALQRNFATELAERDIDRVWATEDVSIITVVGLGMRHTPGVAGRIFSQLGNQDVNVLAIAQGSSEVSISLVVDTADTERAVRALHELILS
jgi:bifunctional aspartokinase / homoserine dehydrogenase 1